MTVALVTGAAGFLGSHLCDYLLSKEYEVIGIDSLITGNLRNIGHINTDDFTFLKHDVRCPFYRCFSDDKVDLVFHLASPASPVDYLNYPIETLEVNSIGTRNTLEFAREKKAKFLLASTSEVYGDPLESPQKEEYWGNVNPIGLRSVYDESKRFGEAMTMTYQRKYRLDTRIVRIFNTYGPRLKANDGRVVSNFVNQALLGEDITVYGNGDQTRSFCYVSDLIEGIYRLMMSIYVLPMNLGCPKEYTIFELANIIIKLTSSEKQQKLSKSKVVFGELPEDDPKQRKPDITKAKIILKWEPKVSLEEGLKETIKYFKEVI